MKKIGITGGIGSGKSLVSQVFKTLGVPVFCADDEAKKMYLLPDVRAKIISIFGNSIYVDGNIDKSQLAQKIFNNAQLLAQVNEIVHTALNKYFNDWCKNQTSSYIILEAAILFESGYNKFVDKIISVSAPQELRITRATLRDNAKPEQIANRIKNQMSDSERNAKSDFVIVNDDKTAVLPQILKIHLAILQS